MGELPFDQWHQAIALQLPGYFDAVNRGDVTPEVVVGLWRLLHLAPSGVRNSFERVPESEIVQAAEAYALAGQPQPVVDKATNDLDACRILGGLLRSAEDQYLDQDTGQAVDPADWAVNAGGVGYYLIPTPRRTAKQPPGDLTKDKRPFARRGLRHMRVLRRDAGGHTVELADHREIGIGQTSLAFSATAFEAVEFSEIEGAQTGHFVVSAIEGPTEEIVRQHLAQAGGDRSFAHVFPELTIDPAMREAIADQLLALEEASEARPTIVVGGSFHDAVEEGYVNRGFVYSRSGKPLLEYRKIVGYSDPEKRHEQIVAGRSIKVMVTAIGLIAFPICKDLCHSYDTPFSELDVDFLLTPSCGDENTISEHKAAAARLHDRFSCRSFVAQQSYPKRTDPVIGFVLPATSNVRKLAEKDIFIQQPFSIRAVS